MPGSNFCSVPFKSLLIEPDGKVGLCRHKGSEHEIGNLNHNTIEEIWNGPVAQIWREEFMKNEPRICRTEVRHRQCHKCEQYSAPIPKEDIRQIQWKMPRTIAFNLNGKCNLECNMCHIWQKPNGLYDKNGFWDQMDHLIKDLEEVELLSGEPFIQKDTYKLIDIISGKKPNCRWSITTNANWKLTPFIKDQLDRIKIRNLIVSIDTIDPKIYPLIRKNGNLKLALQTLKDLVEYEKDRKTRGLSGLQIKVNFLIQQLNWQELRGLAEFKSEYGVEIFRSFLYQPSELSLLSLPEEKRALILDFYMKNLDREENSLTVILPLLDSLPPIYKAQYFSHLSQLRHFPTEANI